jgi:hypothetical protein
VVAVVVVSVLLLTGIIGPLGHSNSGGATTYSTAASQVTAWAANYKGGGWKVFAAEGLAVPFAMNSSVTNLTNLTEGGCSITDLLAGGAPIALPIVSSNPSNGVSGGWIFVLFSSTGFSGVLDLNGSVEPAYYVATSSCTALSEVSLFASGVPSSVIDSSAAAEAAWNAGGSSFVAANSGPIVAQYGITSGISLAGIVNEPSHWNVILQACTAAQVKSGLDVPTFNATVDPSSGAVISTGHTPAPCLGVTPFDLGSTTSSNPPLGANLALGSPVSSGTGTGLNYTFTIEAASGMPWNDLSFHVLNSAGNTVVQPGMVLTVGSIAGSTLATFNLTTDAWTGSSSDLVSATDVLVLHTAGAISPASGDQLMVTATGYSGEILESLP